MTGCKTETAAVHIGMSHFAADWQATHYAWDVICQNLNATYPPAHVANAPQPLRRCMVLRRSCRSTWLQPRPALRMASRNAPRSCRSQKNQNGLLDILLQSMRSSFVAEGFGGNGSSSRSCSTPSGSSLILATVSAVWQITEMPTACLMVNPRTTRCVINSEKLALRLPRTTQYVYGPSRK